ncbi:MAG: thiamine pyrophosphate-binding protein [Deltaproteobacteria bacterium]|nr:thiamine pyrophosphate-binding protein [Deltaproteobacteria bacterium]
MNGGRCVAEVLKAQGVRHIFTLCGGHIAPILVEGKRLGISVIDTRHEANAVFAADAMARLSGIPGVAAVTAGPGVTNAITAVKNAELAQSPLVLLGGATATMLRGRGALQDIDQRALIGPHVKACLRPRALRDVASAVQDAFAIATDGLPGPVFVELAVDLLYPEEVVRSWYQAKTAGSSKRFAARAERMYIRGHLAHLFWGGQNAPAPSAIDSERPAERRAIRRVLPAAVGHRQTMRAAQHIRSARRPLLIVGSQAVQDPNAIPRLVASIEGLGMPTFLSGMARGLLGAEHTLLFRHSRKAALKEADVIVLAGVPADFRLDYGAPLSRAKVVSLNLSATELSKNLRPAFAFLGSPAEHLAILAGHLSASGSGSGPCRTEPATNDWHTVLRDREAKREEAIAELASPARATEPTPEGQPGAKSSADPELGPRVGSMRDRGEISPVTGGLNPLSLLRAIDVRISDNAVIVGDGGDFVASAAYVLKPRGPLSWLDPGVFGTLGVGAGFAIAAKLARPAADVWLIYGDGAAGFSVMEFDTMVRHGIPVIAVVGNDAAWTQIARDQAPILGDDVGTQLTHLDYHDVARACGAEGLRVDRDEDLDATLDRALELSRSGRPVIVNAIIGRSDFRKGSISI